MDSVVGEEPSGFQKKIGKKTWYPFGTPSHKRHAYSDFCHLVGPAHDFAVNLATATGIEPEIREDEPKPTIKKKERVRIEINKELLDDLPESEGGPCTKKACQDVVKSILESQSRNKIEQEEIAEEYEKNTVELQFEEGRAEVLDSKLENLTRDGNQLELTLHHLVTKLQKLEKSKSDLVAEKEAFNGKMMVLESERQSWVRQMHQAESALSDALWIGRPKTTLSMFADKTEREPMEITKPSPKSLQDSQNPTRTAYNRLANSDITDFNERPPGIPSLPKYTQQQLYSQQQELLRKQFQRQQHQQSKSQLTTSSYLEDSQGRPLYGVTLPLSSTLPPSSKSRILGTGSLAEASWSIHKSDSLPWIDKKIRSQTSQSAGLPSPSRRLEPLTASQAQQILQKARSASPHLQLSGGSYKGYVPSGSPTYKLERANLFRSRQTSQDPEGPSNPNTAGTSIPGTAGFGLSTTNSLPSHSTTLDPVFYSSKARQSFARGTQVGSVRVSDLAEEHPLSFGTGLNKVPLPPTEPSPGSPPFPPNTSNSKSPVSPSHASRIGRNVNNHGVLLTSKHSLHPLTQNS